MLLYLLFLLVPSDLQVLLERVAVLDNLEQLVLLAQKEMTEILDQLDRQVLMAQQVQQALLVLRVLIQQ